MSRAPNGEALSPCSLHLAPLTLSVTDPPWAAVHPPPPRQDPVETGSGCRVCIPRASSGSGGSGCLRNVDE